MMLTCLKIIKPMDTGQSSIFDELHDPTARPRKKMIPVWIKVFCWIFLVIGTVAPVAILVMLLLSKTTNISIYGFSTNNALSFIGISGTLLYVYKAFVSYNLLTGKDNAVTFAIIDGWVGIALCVLNMITGNFITEYHIGNESGINLRLELFLVIPYLVKMYRIKDEWNANTHERQQAVTSQIV